MIRKGGVIAKSTGLIRLVVLLDLETMLPLAGVLLGITFGVLSGVSREEKIKQASISVFGAVIVAFIGISFYAYGYSLEVLLGFLIWSFIGFIPTFLIGLGYRRRRDRGGGGVALMPSLRGLDEWEVMEVQKNAPKVDAELVAIHNIFLGYKIEISLKVKNVSNVILNDLHTSLKISDLRLKKKEKEWLHDLPNLVPNEERKYLISERIGRSRNHAVDLRIIRSQVLLAEFHWTVE